MVRQPGFFDLSDRLRDLLARGDDLERMAALVDFAQFRPDLERAVPRSDGSKGGRPAFDRVLMFKVLLLAAMHGLSDERCEYPIKDRLSFMRFLGLGLPTRCRMRTRSGPSGRRSSGPVPWTRCSRASMPGCGPAAIWRWAGRSWMRRSWQHRSSATPRPRRLRSAPARSPRGWTEKPAKLRQKNRDACWTVKFSKARPREDGVLRIDLAVPAFGDKNHVSIDWRHGLIRGWTGTHAAAHDGARLEEVLDAGNTASDVWADTAYRSAKNEAMLQARGLMSRIHCRKPKGRPMQARTRRTHAAKSAVRSKAEHVFAHRQGLMRMVVRTIGLARARVKIGLVNLAYNMRRLVWLSGRAAPA
jgi:IS5 family transposase